LREGWLCTIMTAPSLTRAAVRTRSTLSKGDEPLDQLSAVFQVVFELALVQHLSRLLWYGDDSVYLLAFFITLHELSHPYPRKRRSA
jgi:hypothetical protein